MKPRELRALIKLLRSNGVVSYEAEGLKLLLDPQFKVTTKTKAKQVIENTAEIQEQLNNMLPQLTDEQWLIATNMPSIEDEAMN